jgi:membrane carboxypeptidase/penicillin-binding protein PbpC
LQTGGEGLKPRPYAKVWILALLLILSVLLPSAVLYWHLDDKYVARTVGEHDLMLRPEPGAHLLVAMDSNGASRSVYFIVK